jgi:hypothetical protein
MSSTAEQLKCVINLSVAPSPWLEWRYSSMGAAPKSVTAPLGLYRDRLHPTGSPAERDTWWQVHHDADAREAAHDMVAQLQAQGLPRLLNLLDRENLLAAVRAGDLGFFKSPNFQVLFKRAEAVLIADRGLTPELQQLLHYDITHSTPRQQQNAELFADWARTRALAATK